MTVPEPGHMEWAQVPDPVPGPGEVLVEIAASAVNRADLLQVAGFYAAPPGAPPYPGLECSGVTPEGTWVCALLSGGGYAQRVAVPREHLMPVPGDTREDAAALPEAACTVYSNLTMAAELRPHETVLIHGGGSGIGTFAIQYAKALGAKVITTARAAKHQRLRELGADVCIDYTGEDFATAEADVVLDIMGASYLERNVRALKEGGRLVVIGLQGGRSGELDLSALMGKRATVIGTMLRSRPKEQKTEIISRVLSEVWPLIEEGRITPVIDRRIPLPDAAAAHRLVATNEHVGKVLLTAS
jgi:putative PIG3 family NAD(P)H quinone oxidoreductase